KMRKFPAKREVWAYFSSIREISKATGDKDFVFTVFNGQKSSTLYGKTIRSLLQESGLLIASSGKSRSTYCFRHTFATEALFNGTSVYDLAKHLGTSV